MCVEVLATKHQIIKARAEMRGRKLHFVSSRIERVLRKTRIINGVSVGDLRKSWDVLKTIEYLEKNLSKGAAILDIGAYASELICALHQLRYSDLTAIDLNAKLSRMPYGDSIRYIAGNFLHTPFSPETFEAITAISVMEHGFQGQELIKEISRILKRGGYFIASVDYWPEKIDTSGIEAFGVDWRIFSQQELRDFIEQAKSFGFNPVGDINFSVSEPTIRWYGKDYTIAWLVLQKSTGPGT